VFFVRALGASGHELVPKAGELAWFLRLARASLRRRRAPSTKAEDRPPLDSEP
jgi:hypothetical protein